MSQVALCQDHLGHKCICRSTGCSNQMQVAQGQDMHFKVAPLCKLHLVAASHSNTCAQDGLATVQVALVVFSLALAHLLMCTQTNIGTYYNLHCMCGGGCGGIVYAVVVIVCGGAWLSVVVLAGHGGDGRLCVAVVVLLMYMFIWRLWFIMNKGAS